MLLVCPFSLQSSGQGAAVLGKHGGSFDVQAGVCRHVQDEAPSGVGWSHDGKEGVVWVWGLRPLLENVKGRSVIETTCFLVLSPLKEAKSSPYIMAICGDQIGHQMRSAQRYACVA